MADGRQPQAVPSFDLYKFNANIGTLKRTLEKAKDLGVLDVGSICVFESYARSFAVKLENTNRQLALNIAKGEVYIAQALEVQRAVQNFIDKELKERDDRKKYEAEKNRLTAQKKAPTKKPVTKKKVTPCKRTTKK